MKVRACTPVRRTGPEAYGGKVRSWPVPGFEGRAWADRRRCSGERLWVRDGEVSPGTSRRGHLGQTRFHGSHAARGTSTTSLFRVPGTLAPSPLTGRHSTLAACHRDVPPPATSRRRQQPTPKIQPHNQEPNPAPNRRSGAIARSALRAVRCGWVVSVCRALGPSGRLSQLGQVGAPCWRRRSGRVCLISP